MEFDMPYGRFREMARAGLAALPSSGGGRGGVAEAGIVAAPEGVLCYSADYGTGRRARADVGADGESRVESCGAIGLPDIDMRSFERDVLRTEAADGHDGTVLRMRCRAESDGTGAVLSWLVYAGEPQGVREIAKGRVRCVPLAETFMFPGPTAGVTIRQAGLRRCLGEFGTSAGKGATLHVGNANSLPFMILERVGISTRIELAPRELELSARHGGISLAYGDFLDAVGRAPGGEITMGTVPPVFGRNMVRFRLPGGILDLPGEWFWELPLFRRFEAPKSVRPLMVDRRELDQAAVMFRGWNSEKVRIRHRLRRPFLTLIRGSRVKKGKSAGGVAATDCLAPSGGKDVATWCVRAAGLVDAVKDAEGDRVRIYPAGKALIIDSPGRPFVRHRLAGVPPDGLDDGTERELLAIEASMGEPAVAGPGAG